MRFLRTKYIPFGYKLMFSYLVFVVFIVSLITYVANTIYTNSILEQTRKNLSGTLTQMEDNILYKLDDIQRISDMLYFDSTLSRHLRNFEDGWVSYEATTKYLIPKFSSTVEATSRKLWMSIYLHNESYPEIYSDYRGSDPTLSKMSLFDLFHMKRIKEKEWYKYFPDEVYGKTFQWKQVEDDQKFGRISLLRRLVDSTGPVVLPEIGFIRISARYDELLESVDHQKIGESATMLIVSDSHEIIKLSSGDEQMDTSILNILYTDEINEHYLLLDEHIPGLNWRMIALVPLTLLEKDMRTIQKMTLLISIVCSFMFILAGGIIARYFSKKVNRITHVLDSFKEGSFHKRIWFKGNDEFTHISRALNDMGQNIGDLIHKVYVSDIKKKEAELEMLQAQINPHFLYNTLSSIHRLAKFGQNDKLQRMVLDLAQFYRLSLSEGRTIIPISSELDQVQAYINIQKIKYGDRMQVYYQLDPKIYSYSSMKLILQPFVENALEHAWRGDHIAIQIRGEVIGQKIAFKIIDDGVGIHPDLLEQIMNQTDSFSIGYGIRNVDQRIQLHYGEHYGVQIHSKLGIGTTVILTIPAMK